MQLIEIHTEVGKIEALTPKQSIAGKEIKQFITVTARGLKTGLEYNKDENADDVLKANLRVGKGVLLERVEKPLKFGLFRGWKKDVTVNIIVSSERDLTVQDLPDL